MLILRVLCNTVLTQSVPSLCLGPSINYVRILKYILDPPPPNPAF